MIQNTGMVQPNEKTTALLDALLLRAEDELRSTITGKASCALIDFPNYANVGESAIWMGRADS